MKFNNCTNLNGGNFMEGKNLKFEKKNGLNKNAIEIVKYYNLYKEAVDEQVKQCISFYVLKNLKFNSAFSIFKSENDLIAYLSKDKKMLISTKEQIESSRDFANSILDFDRLLISSKTDARTKCLIIIKSIGLKKSQAEKMFDNFTFSDFDKFVPVFVNKYMRMNAKNFISTIQQENFTISFSDIYKSKFGYWNFDIEFNIKVDDLDEKTLTNIGNIIMNMPKFA